jgi:BMFP domain-containing protein YqiC
MAQVSSRGYRLVKMSRLIGPGPTPIIPGEHPGHFAQYNEVSAVTQTTNRFLDDLARLLTDAAGAAQGMRREVETLMKAQGERILRDMDLVQREEFEAVKDMAAKARDENERLSARLSALEAELARLRQ